MLGSTSFAVGSLGPTATQMSGKETTADVGKQKMELTGPRHTSLGE